MTDLNMTAVVLPCPIDSH